MNARTSQAKDLAVDLLRDPTPYAECGEWMCALWPLVNEYFNAQSLLQRADAKIEFFNRLESLAKVDAQRWIDTHSSDELFRFRLEAMQRKQAVAA